ncbi:hypothetical protein scyTo_0000687, partial [Scyliorhinus torazame]|nr:hypothetical protein [Scyliorhinus torazame]
RRGSFAERQPRLDMGNENSLEPGELEPISAPAAAAPAPPLKTAAAPNGAPGGRAAAAGSARPHQRDHLGQPDAKIGTPRQTVPSNESARRMQNQGCSTQQNLQQEQRRTLQVDTSTKRGERSHSASPDRGSAPTSPYSVPQIAPMPSSTLCPICATTELNSSPKQPNFNTCTQCRSVVCKQCGFNPNPHITEVEEWLCLNCQMQRALGMDMTTAPRSKSQQQLHSPSHQAQAKPQAEPQAEPQAKPQKQPQADPALVASNASLSHVSLKMASPESNQGYILTTLRATKTAYFQHMLPMLEVCSFCSP